MTLKERVKIFSMADVLGLVTHLKEEKKCKVVIICNKGAFKSKDEKEFR